MSAHWFEKIFRTPQPHSYSTILLESILMSFCLVGGRWGLTLLPKKSPQCHNSSRSLAGELYGNLFSYLTKNHYINIACMDRYTGREGLKKCHLFSTYGLTYLCRYVLYILSQLSIFHAKGQNLGWGRSYHIFLQKWFI